MKLKSEQFESHWIRADRIRMLVLARPLRNLSNHPAYLTGREIETKKDKVICPRPETKMGKVLVIPSVILFQGNFSLKQSSSSTVRRSFSVHSCLLSVNGETGWGMGQGNYALKKSFFPPLVCKHSNNGADLYHWARAHEYIQLGIVGGQMSSRNSPLSSGGFKTVKTTSSPLKNQTWL